MWEVVCGWKYSLRNPCRRGPAHLKPDCGMEESIITAGCGMKKNMVMVRSRMYKREPMTNIKSGWVARWGEGLWNAECPSRYTFDQQGASCQPGCEDTDMPRFNPRPKSSTESSQQRILLRLISVCELILCREWGAQANKQTLHKTAKSLLCEHSLACTVKQWV